MLNLTMTMKSIFYHNRTVKDLDQAGFKWVAVAMSETIKNGIIVKFEI